MSLVAMTGFDHDVYGSRFSLTGSIAASGRFGRGRYARFSNGGHFCDLTFTPSEYHDALVIGFATRDVIGPYLDMSFQSSFIRLFGDAGQDHISIYWTSPGAGQYAIRVRRGDGTILATSAPLPLVTGAWHYYEFKVTIDDAVGTVEVRRDQTPIINISGVDTRNGGTNANVYWMRFGNNADNNYGSLDDVYVLRNDGAGKTDFIGEVEVEALVPNGNGNYSQLTGSDGNSLDNYLLVDDAPAVNDADYAGSATDGLIDTYALSNLVRPSTTVNGVQFSMRVRKSDTAAKSIRRVIRSGGVDSTGADIPLSSSFIWTNEILEQNPFTASDWNQTDIDGIEFGTEVRP